MNEDKEKRETKAEYETESMLNDLMLNGCIH